MSDYTDHTDTDGRIVRHRRQRQRPRRVRPGCTEFLACFLSPFRFLAECYFGPLGRMLAAATVVAIILSVLLGNIVPTMALLPLHATLRTGSFLLNMPKRLLIGPGTFVWCHTIGLGCKSSQRVDSLRSAAHRVRSTAATSLDIFDSFAHGMRVAQAESVSAVDLWVMADTVSAMRNVPDVTEFASSIGELRDAVTNVEDGLASVNRAGWHAFSSIHRWIERIHAELLEMHSRKKPNSQSLAELLSKLSLASRRGIGDLIAQIDDTLMHTARGLSAASTVRRRALAASSHISDTRHKRWHPFGPRGEKQELAQVDEVRTATDTVQRQLHAVRRLLVDYQENAGDFDAEFASMEILTIEQELRELAILRERLGKVMDDAKKANLDALAGATA